MQPTKYFLYARKSSETEERQVKSIEDQLLEMNELASRSGIRIAKTFIESKSAKTPGREIFNDMLMKVYASKEPVGILAWHPDRLARNSVDGGQIIYMIDIKKITALKFATFWFEPTPQGLFMLQIAFGQSKYYSDNLSENIKRGNRQKVKRGEYLAGAPLGYVRNIKTKNIDVDPVKALILKNAFEQFATGKHSYKSLGEYMYMLGITSSTGKAIASSSLSYMLNNTAYLGLIKYNNEIYEGTFEPIISKELFEAVQMQLKHRARPRKRRNTHHFPFTTLFLCAECGSGITAQFARGRGGLYKYYRCTKKRGRCSQRYLIEHKFVAQIKERFKELILPEKWCLQEMEKAKQLEKRAHKDKQTFIHEAERKILSVGKRLDKLVETFLDGSIEREIYLDKKQELIIEKMNITKKQGSFERKQVSFVRPLQDFISTCKQAKALSNSDDEAEIKGLLLRTTTNRAMKDKNLYWDWVPPFDIVTKPEVVWEWAT